MSKINILAPSVYNKIAAGEVVDRPYSVVKELVENAIDAGATEISIYIEKAGTQLIRVVDNGSGIERDDLHSAFLPHATSKLAAVEDLNGIMTLGFRGEAVASIASVSKMTITSKTENGKCYQLKSDGGELGQITEVAGENGTDVCVEMLFFNVPARYKFMKADKAEETEITTFVSRFILGNSNIAFTYYVDGEQILQSFGGGDEEALVSVYGVSTLKQCYRIDAERNGIRLRGYIGNQNFYKANKSYQTLFLNGRFITNATIAPAISTAYESYLMKRQYPFYVLKMEMPPEFVDVNVHPNKMDVRFSNNKLIFGTLRTIVSSVLDGNAKALEYVVDAGNSTSTVDLSDFDSSSNKPKEVEQVKEEKPLTSISERILKTEDSAASLLTEEDLTVDVFGSDTKDWLSALGGPQATAEEIKKQFEDANVAQAVKWNPNLTEEQFRKGFTPMDEIGDYTGKYLENDSHTPEQLRKIAKRKNPENLQKKHHPDMYFERTWLHFSDTEAQEGEHKPATTDAFEENKRYLEELEKQNKQNRIEISSCRYVGKLFNTYLVYERDNAMFIIDQHAAHERLIFNKFKENVRDRKVAQQPMLIPFEMRLNAFEADFIRERAEDIREMGFELEITTENAIKVSAVPTDLAKINLTVFFNDILAEVNSYRAIKLEDILKDKLATAACKAAIKGGMDITQEEIDSLFTMMDGDLGLKCPHGRPVVVKISKTEIEKMFKRIV